MINILLGHFPFFSHFSKVLAKVLDILRERLFCGGSKSVVLSLLLEFHALYEVTIIPVTQGILEVRENFEDVAEEVVS